MIISKGPRNAQGWNGENTAEPTTLELGEGGPAGIGLTITQPSFSGPPQAVGITLTPVEARQVGARLAAYAAENGAS